MKTDTTILAFQHPDEIDDPLTSVLRDGARRLLALAKKREQGDPPVRGHVDRAEDERSPYAGQ